MKNLNGILGLALIGTLVACGQKQIGESSVNTASLDGVQSSVESGITAIQAVADDQAGSALAQGGAPNFSTYAQSIWSQLLPEAWAATCTRALFEACVPTDLGSQRLANYTNCVLAGGARANGFVKLSYSNANCQLNVGDTVNRTYDVTLTGVYGASLEVSSSDSTDYRGQTMGGGGQIQRLSANQWELTVPGKHKVLSFGNKKLFDVSIRSTAPMTISNTLNRNGRVLDGGSYEVNHNLAQFTATYSPNNLTWTGTCCHPVSGTLNVVYSGSVTGSAQVTFQGCGSATLTKDNLSRTVTLNYCE